MAVSADLSTKFALDVQAVDELRIASKKMVRPVLKPQPGSLKPCS